MVSPLAGEGGRWGDEAKMVVVYLVAVVVSFLAFSGTSWGLYFVMKVGDGWKEDGVDGDRMAILLEIRGLQLKVSRLYSSMSIRCYFCGEWRTIISGLL